MYELNRLGWHSFQKLCHTIAGEILGQTVESFPDSNDGGRDGAFTGKWKTVGEEDLRGPFVIQCKHKSQEGRSLTQSDISEELSKIEKLVKSGRCRSYILMTNAGVSGTQREKMCDRIKSKGVEYVRVFDYTWICRQIQEKKRLRMLVPRMYGLGDLSQILDDRAYEQAISILESMRDDLAKVVVTDAYARADKAVLEHRFVLLIGEPASGKTTIASLLSLAAFDQGDASILKLDNPEDVAKHWNPNEPSQFFWFDDAFGVTQYDQSLVNRWNQVLPRFHAMLRRRATIVMTSRDYIYNRAREQLKEPTFPLLRESQVVVDVRELSIQEKEQILYNHIRMGDQTQAYRTKIKQHLHDVANHPGFIPEIARRLGSSLFTKNLLVTASNIRRFVERREGVLQDIIKGLDNDSRAALALIYIRNGGLESPISPRPSERMLLDRMGSSYGGCSTAIEAMNGSLARSSLVNGDRVWQFSHPTVGDAYAATIVHKHELLEVLLQGGEPENLLNIVTCGEVGIENAVVVPKSFFSLMMQKLGRLEEIESSSTAPSSLEAKRLLFYFLAYRCSKEFLSLYLNQNQELPTLISRPRLMLEVVPEVPLAIRLHEFGLLPENQRKAIVASISNYALEGDDASALTNDGIRSLFTDHEYAELIDRLKIELLPRLEEVRIMWEEYFDPTERAMPDEHMDPLLEFLDSLLVTFGKDQDIARQIEHESDLVSHWIANCEWDNSEWDNSEWEEFESFPRQPESIRSAGETRSARSIFDDIDAEM